MQKLLAVVAVLLGLGFGASGWQKIQEGRASFGWPRVPGKVLQASSEADLRRRVDPLTPGETEVVYRPRIEYAYSVAGRSFTNHRYSIEELAHSGAGAQSRVWRFRPGSEVTVHYRPDNPAYSILVPGVSHQPWVLAVAGLLTAGWGVWRWVRPARQPSDWHADNE